MPNLFNNPWKSKTSHSNNEQRPPLYGNAYDSNANISLDSYNSDSHFYGNYQQSPYDQNRNSQPLYYQHSYHSPQNYADENAWDSGKHEYSHFDEQQNNSNGGWFSRSKVAPQNIYAKNSMKSPKSPKKAATHTPFLEHRQGPQNAYQFSGTRYGNPPPVPKRTTRTSNSTKQSKWNEQPYHTPNKWRFWFRFLSLLTSIGYLGFAAGASPYSGDPIPFSTTSCFYYLYAVSIISIIWSLFHVLFYFYRRIFKKQKFNRVVLFFVDLLLAFLWGIGLIIEAVKYKCLDGGKFCAFYNVSLFWGFFSFALYIVSVGWDLFGACNQRH